MNRSDQGTADFSTVKEGADVYGADDRKVGRVAEVHDSYFIAEKGVFFHKDLYIPTSALSSVEGDRVYLNVAKDEVGNQGWDVIPDAAVGDTGATAVRDRIPDSIGTPGDSGRVDEGGRMVRAGRTGGAADATTGQATDAGQPVGAAWPAGTSTQRWEDVMPGYRTAWQQRYGTAGGRWEDAEPGYRYGWQMTNDPRYQGRSWAEVEPELRRDWGTRYSATPWDRVGQAIHDVWDSVTNSG